MLDNNYKYTYWLKVPILDIFLKKILNYNRQKIHKIFLQETHYKINNTLIDIGSSNTEDNNHNIILQKTSNNFNIYSLSNTNLNKIKKKYKNIQKFYKADGKNTGLETESFDIVFSSATIEHVGSFKNQVQFTKELYRLSKKTVFITTPNRYYPIDFHTKLPLIHWLPKNLHRKLLNLFGLKFYAKEANLNLLDSNDIKNIMKLLNINNFKIINYKFLFFKSNIIIIINK